MTRVTEIWQTKFGEIFKVTHNPCNCHPFDVMVERDLDRRSKKYRFKKAVSYSINSRSAFTARMKKNGNVRLERKVLKLGERRK